jgi:hypothetical protein
MPEDLISKIIHQLPSERADGKPVETRVMTVRLPAALRDLIKDEARARKTSANKLAIAKLSIRGEVLDRVAAAMKQEAAAVRR